MGLSGGFLKRKQEIKFSEIVEEVNEILDTIGYIHHCERQKGTFKNYSYDYFSINIWKNENSDRELLIYVDGKEDKFEPSFDWIRQGADLYRIVYIEDFSGREDMLLKFAYAYLKKFPNDIFWDDLDWYYTKDDIEKIMNRPYDKDWCYKNPKDYL